MAYLLADTRKIEDGTIPSAPTGAAGLRIIGNGQGGRRLVLQNLADRYNDFLDRGQVIHLGNRLRADRFFVVEDSTPEIRILKRYREDSRWCRRPNVLCSTNGMIRNADGRVRDYESQRNRHVMHWYQQECDRLRLLESI